MKTKKKKGKKTKQNKTKTKTKQKLKECFFKGPLLNQLSYKDMMGSVSKINKHTVNKND